jgi:DNA-binding NtrC family response regulator
VSKPAARSGNPFEETTRPMRSSTAEPLLPVIVRALDAEGTSFRLAAGVCLVGTSPGAHLVLRDPTVSRQHCELELVAGGISVTDLDSKNGTFYLGKKVDRIVLPAGASFHAGEVQIAIEPDVERFKLEPSKATHLGLLIGESLSMRRLFTLIERLRGSGVPVLIEGESGAGKEACARTIHAEAKSGGPFVVVRCASLPRELFAAELFGPRGEASSGAIARARGGTLFLDEVDALPLDLQPALLEILESGEMGARDGGAPTPFRLVSSTSKNLEDEVRAGRMRDGLYFRLSTVRLQVPPLRDRREDIAPLARTFAAEVGLTSLPDEIIEQLKTRAWSGNLRELKSAVLAYAALGALPAPSRIRGGILDLALGEITDATRPYAAQKDDLVDRFTRKYLEDLMRHTDGNQSVAARLAGLDRTYLGRLLVKHGVKS